MNFALCTFMNYDKRIYPSVRKIDGEEREGKKYRAQKYRFLWKNSFSN